MLCILLLFGKMCVVSYYDKVVYSLVNNYNYDRILEFYLNWRIVELECKIGR